ncbi:GreA/GreB family elongation factor [uncultured Zhongshania sp.]|jgi:regulator of nucleoside diphosphate kinase|uniref:GreA/GreB family elongation factor n=1 Tax=uncultured Zhongshania sp. TaxID=1642288 RepID=UPI0030D861E2|tara:strand:- start:360 stop:752 length:393 start_codon:yes stop_codon:yes gene_type:complete
MIVDNTDDIVVKRSDYKRIVQLMMNSSLDIRDGLENEMARAIVYNDDVYPKDAVCLGSIVEFVDVTTKAEGRVTVVLPDDANVKEMKVSVLSPLGAALIGLRKNTTINWIMPGSRVAEIKVVNITHPEDG